MAAAIHVKYRFTQFQQGWSLNLYDPVTDINTARNNAKSRKLLEALLGILDKTVLLHDIYLRRVWDGNGAPPEPARDKVPLKLAGQSAVTDPTEQRPAVNVGAGTTLMVPVDTGGRPDVTMTAALIHLDTDDGLAQRKMWIRGLPDNWTERFSETGQPARNFALGKALDVFLKKLIGKYAIRRVKPPSEATFAWQDIDYLQSSEGGTNTRVQMFAAHGLSKGNLIQFTGHTNIMGLQPLRGIHRVVDAGTDWFKVHAAYHLDPFEVDSGPPIIMGNNIQNLRARKIEYTFPLIQEAVFEELRSRDTGRPHNLTRGRKKGRSWRHAPRVAT